MDKEWKEGILNKDQKSVHSFIQAFQDQVYSQAFRLLGNTHDAEEASQDVFVKALQKMHEFKGGSKLSTWLYRITYTTCLDMIKKRKRRPVLIEWKNQEAPSWTNLHDSLQQLMAKEQQEIIDGAIQRLEHTDSLIIELFHMQGVSTKEIGEITGMTVGAIKVRLMRARKKLAVILLQLLPSETIKTYRNDR